MLEQALSVRALQEMINAPQADAVSTVCYLCQCLYLPNNYLTNKYGLMSLPATNLIKYSYICTVIILF